MVAGLLAATIVSSGAALSGQGVIGQLPGPEANRWMEVRLGIAVPGEPFRTGPEFGGRIGSGPALSLRGGATVWGPLGLQIGLSQYRNPCETDGCGVGRSWRTRTLDIGVRGDHTYRGVQLWAFGGGIFPWLLRPKTGGGTVQNRVRIAGEAGFGVRLPVTGRFALAPGLRYTSFNAVFDGVGGSSVRLIVLDLGFHYRF